jgi:antitoxin (DNA-binding transcriptional repressor) of toxin-antitoxin stability system
MQQYNIHTAKTHLSVLVDYAAAGDSFIIAKAGKAMVKVIPISTQKTDQRIGFLKGQINIPDDFDKMGQAQIINDFEG